MWFRTYFVLTDSCNDSAFRKSHRNVVSCNNMCCASRHSSHAAKAKERYLSWTEGRLVAVRPDEVVPSDICASIISYFIIWDPVHVWVSQAGPSHVCSLRCGEFAQQSAITPQSHHIY
jgi:hypothetical protein